MAGKLRVGLIGLGGVSEVHLQGYRDRTLIEVVAGADVRADRVNALADEYGFKPYTDYGQMVAEENLDIACVLTPCSTHEDVAIACARAGVNVLCEKPIALSLAAVDRMEAACAEAGVMFFYGSSYRFLPAVSKARDLIEQGAIGDVTLMRECFVGGQGAAAQRELPPIHYPLGGPGGTGLGMVDHGVHLIDIFPWLTGSRVTSVFGRGNISGAPLRTEYAMLHLDNGAVGELVYNDATFGAELPNEGAFSWGGSWDPDGNIQPPGQWQSHPGSITVHGTTGALRILHYCNALYLITAEGTRQIPVSDDAMPGNFGQQVEAFARNIRDKSAPATDIGAGRRALEVLLALYESAEGGRLVTV